MIKPKLFNVKMKQGKIITVFVIICLTALISCGNEDNLLTPIEQVEFTDSCKYSISEEQALRSLQKFLKGASKTRAVSSENISSIYPIKYDSIQTVVGLPKISHCENILYIANIGNNQGFAILAGDSRIEEDVIAVTDEGSLLNRDINMANIIQSLIKPTLDDYPQTGDGFYTTDEYPDEIFMNPNTVSLYDENEDDYLIGDFDLEVDNEDLGDAAIIQDSVQIKNTQNMICAMCLSYSLRKLHGHDLRMVDDGDTPYPQNPPSYTILKDTTDWSEIKEISPMLSNYKEWDQHSPFNDMCPERRLAILFGHKRRALAGCFPLAISKIFAYFEQPSVFVYNGVEVNWQSLKQDYQSTQGAKSAAALLRGIGSGCDSWYFYQGTFTFPNKATSYMRFVGYENARSYDYKFSRVVDMLDGGKPIIIYAIPGINIFKSHCWNIDGYQVKERTITTRKYIEGVLDSETAETEQVDVVHCDFGWGGHCNGYYVSGVFDLENPFEFDNKMDKGSNNNYNTLLKIVTYAK